MTDRHRDPVINTRAPTHLRDAARAALQQRGWSVEAYLAACLAAVAASPDEVLPVIAPYALPPRPRGRPRRTEPVSQPAEPPAGE